MALPFAFVTLLTSDAYLPGVLALVGALKEVHPSPPVPPEVDFQTACLVTPETVDVAAIKLLRRVFNVVIGVELIGQEDEKGLQLLGRPDLHAVLTKLHIFRLTQYSKIIFLDADVLPVRPLSHLFHTVHPFSAASDVGWPDIFNSGVLVVSPGEDKFEELRALLKSQGSWDGGDQGLLNEWRGSDWNRLSFTYNTTPTAAYTYAPAYERFGSQISAIHFVGPYKPWTSLPYRFPGASSFQDHTSPEHQLSTSTPPQAYDYDSLVDRWYAVYDAHYRTHSTIVKSELEVQRYVSVGDERMDTRDTLDLNDDVEGTHVDIASTRKETGEGEYMSLPLDGRVDLMRHPEEKEDVILLKGAKLRMPVWEQRDLVGNQPWSPPRDGTMPTPEPDELPPIPYMGEHSLPPSGWHQPEQHQHGIHTPQPPPEYQERPRILSTPLLSWNPSIEPSPKTTRTPSDFLSDTYFPNIWDQSTHANDTSRLYIPDSHAFFEVPPPSEIPEELLRQGHYQNVTGPHSDESTIAPSPDRAKVKRVFPWEERPRQLPRRVFPGSESPSPGVILIESQKIEVSLPAEVSTPGRQIDSQSHATSSPLNIGFRPNLTFANAWDSVPQITKYANRLVKPAPWPQSPLPLVAPFNESLRRRKSWDDHLEVSSRDGDDEGDSDGDEDEGGTGRWDDSSEETKTSKTRSRSGSGSIPAGRLLKGNTARRVKRSIGVQVPDSEDEKTASLREIKLSMGLDTPPPVVMPGASLPAQTKQTFRPTSSFPTPHSASGLRSPREVTSPQGSSSPTQVGLAVKVPLPPLPLTESKLPNESDIASPHSSIGPISSSDSQSTGLPPREGRRVWDPARGVELFKRESEELLARFLKMGSLEEDATA